MMQVRWPLSLLVIAAIAQQVGGEDVAPELAPGFPGAKRLLSLVDVAKEAAAQNEIGLSDKTRLNRLLSRRAKAIDEALAKAGVHPSAIRRMSSEDRVAKAEEIFAKIFSATSSASAPFDVKLKEALSAEQFKRLVEIFAQWGGVDALASPVIAEALALSKEQRASLEALRAKMDLAFQTTSPVTVEERMKLAAEMTNRASEILDDNQQDKLRALRGKPFDAQRFFTEDPVFKALSEFGSKGSETK